MKHWKPSRAEKRILLAVLLILPLKPFAHGDDVSTVRASKPNIIFILADDLGYGELSLTGQERFATPAIDQLAKEGIVFTNHYAGSTVCAPSRSTLMTGLHTGHTRVRNNFGVDPKTGERIRVGLLNEDVTIAELVKEAGYRTGIVGKWGLGEEGTEGTPLKQGFDRFFGFLNQARAHDHYPEWVWDQDERVSLPGNENEGEAVYIHDLFTEKALDFIAASEEDSRPFFLYLAYTLPHSDLKAPHDKDGPAPETPDAIFAAMVERLDRDVGSILARLEKLGLANNTIVFFSSDNGPHQQEGKDNDYFRASGPFRGIKRDLYEGGIRVPLIVRWPGKVVPGSVSTHESAFWDFLPTAAEIADATKPEGLDGISYLPAIQGLPNQAHEYLYWEFVVKEETWRAVRLGDWKAVIHGERTPELYHLPTDPGERTDRSQLYPHVTSRILKILEEAHEPSPHFPLGND